jgi:hypothetical protein
MNFAPVNFAVVRTAARRPTSWGKRHREAVVNGLSTTVL